MRQGGKANGHKSPSLVAKDSVGTATCISQFCFESDDIFGIVAKMENLNLEKEFPQVIEKVCSIGGISYEIIEERSQQGIVPIRAKESIVNGIKQIGEVYNLEQKHFDYLESVVITQETALSFNLKARYDYILYPQLDLANGDIVGYKGISISKDEKSGRRKMFFEGERSALWYRVCHSEDSIEDNSPSKKPIHIIFVEGEKDCMRLTQEIGNAEEQSEDFLVVTITTGAG